MTVPLLVLAVLSVGAGWPLLFDDVQPFAGIASTFRGVINDIPNGHHHPDAHHVVLYTSIGVMLVGALAAYFFYRPSAKDSLAEKVPGAFSALSLIKAVPDTAYGYYVQKVQQRFALFINFLEQILLAGLIVRGVAGLVGLVGMGARALHVGSLHAYVYWFFLGAILMWGFASGLF